MELTTREFSWFLVILIPTLSRGRLFDINVHPVTFKVPRAPIV